MNHEDLLRLANAYVSNPAVAAQLVENIENEENPVRRLSEECVKYIRSRESDLFQNPPAYTPQAKEPENLGEEDLKALDYEERIIVLMVLGEQLNFRETADLLGIEVEHVHAWLQSAYRKTHPAVTHAVVEVREKRETAKADPGKDKPRIPRFAVIAVLVLATVAGLFFGIRAYAHGQYEDGVEAMMCKDYEQALEHLTNASRYGSKAPDLEMRLADANYFLGNYEDAQQLYEKVLGTGFNDRLLGCYEALADKCLMAGDKEEAVRYLRRSYVLAENEKTSQRIEALRGDGTYTDANGNIFDAYGDPVRLFVSTGKGAYAMYVTCDDSRNWQKVNETVLDAGPDCRVHVIFDNGTLKVEKTMLDEHGNPVKRILDGQETVYENTYEDGVLTLVRVIAEGKPREDTYVYEKGLLSEISSDSGERTVFQYNPAGLLTRKSVREHQIAETSYETWSYDEEGRLISSYSSSEGTTTVYSLRADGTPYYQETKDKDGNPVSYAWLKKDNGMIEIMINK